MVVVLKKLDDDLRRISRVLHLQKPTKSVKVVNIIFFITKNIIDH
jgi:hypothetical protein